MADVTVKRLAEFEAIFGGGFLRVRAGLGVSSFGIAVMELPANYSDYPEHDQTHDNQEEVYTALTGRATLRVGDEEIALEPGVWARVGIDEKRKIVTGDEPATVLAVGGSPGAVYDAPEFTNEGGGLSALKAELHGNQELIEQKLG
jgi:mannose-6-phosphate isomerase-like protein (cupin superfamily)